MLKTLSSLLEINDGDSTNHRRVCKIPSYDKSLRKGRGDRVPLNQWRSITSPVDIILLEGWMLGFTPVENNEINTHCYTAASAEADKKYGYSVNSNKYNHDDNKKTDDIGSEPDTEHPSDLVINMLSYEEKYSFNIHYDVYYFITYLIQRCFLWNHRLFKSMTICKHIKQYTN